jgi:hypothetical protein
MSRPTGRRPGREIGIGGGPPRRGSVSPFHDRPVEELGGADMPELSEKKRDKLPASSFAFPKQRKEPLNDAAHVRNAIARFNQVEGVSQAEREAAWKRIKKAAKKFDVEIEDESMPR